MTSYKVILQTKHDITCQTVCKSIFKDCFFAPNTWQNKCWCSSSTTSQQVLLSSQCFNLWVNLHSRSNVLLKDWRTLIAWMHCFFHFPVCISGALEMPFLVIPVCCFRKHLSWDNMEVLSTERWKPEISWNKIHLFKRSSGEHSVHKQPLKQVKRKKKR